MGVGAILFFVVAAALAGAVVLLLVLALLRGRGADQAEDTELRVYKDQLAEVERDLARGVLGADEAARVRVEVSRRLLAADAARRGGAGAAPAGLSRGAAVLVGATLLLGSGALYLLIGAPGAADRPLALRILEAEEARAARPSQAAFEAANPVDWAPPPGADPELLALVDRLRAAVAENPDEIRGQMLLARNEASLGNFRAAHPAAAQVIRLKGAEATAADHASQLDLMVLAAQGYVSPQAEALAHRVLALDPQNGTARYYLGLMYAQGARPDLALGLWGQLLRESSVRAPWAPPILAQIDEVAAAAGARFAVPDRFLAPPDLPGPSAAEMATASEMEAGDRAAMIEGMVEGLAERLAAQGGSAAGWARLITALGVLGQAERATAIWAEAQRAFADAPEALAEIRAAAIRAGLAE